MLDDKHCAADPMSLINPLEVSQTDGAWPCPLSHCSCVSNSPHDLHLHLLNEHKQQTSSAYFTYRDETGSLVDIMGDGDKQAIVLHDSWDLGVGHAFFGVRPLARQSGVSLYTVSGVTSNPFCCRRPKTIAVCAVMNQEAQGRQLVVAAVTHYTA